MAAAPPAGDDNKTDQMKSLAAAAIFPLCILIASAQEESPTPAEKLSLRATDPGSQEEPIVSIPSERSSKYPRPGTPLSTPKPSPSVAAASPSPAPKKGPSPAGKPPASPAPVATAITPAPKAVAAAVKEMENKWLTALQGHDSDVVDSLVADNYIGVTATGRSVNKAALLAELKKDKNSYESTKNTSMEVRAHGDAAVVVGTTRQTGTDATGKAFTYYYRWTDTWALRDGQWLCVASQSIQVPK